MEARPRLDLRGGARAAHDAYREGISPSAVRDATGRAPVGTGDRARDHAAWPALHWLHLQHLRPTAGDSALDGDADPGESRTGFPCRVGRPLLLGLPELCRSAA